MNPEIKQLIECTNQLLKKGHCSGDWQSQIGGAFVLNNMALLPMPDMDVIEAWRQLDRTCQRRVATVKTKYMDLITKPEPIGTVEHLDHPERFMIVGQYLVRYPTNLGDK